MPGRRRACVWSTASFSKAGREISLVLPEAHAIQIADLALADGRPRIPAKAVHMFLMRRGFLGSLSAQQAVCVLHESISMYAWLQERGLEMPGVSTILDNINAVRHTLNS